jgi:rod shape determining protein RodA
VIAVRQLASRAVASPRPRIRDFDWPLLAAVLAAIAFGTAMIYSATFQSPVPDAWDDLVVKQLTFAALGLVLLALLSATEYRVLVTFWTWVYGGTVLTLIVLRLVGHTVHGSQRWFTTGIGDVQPSEFAKIALIVCLAAYFERYDIRRLRHVTGSLLLTALPMLLVARQPDLSSALILGAIWLGMAIAAGLRGIHLSVLALLGTPVVTFVLRAGLLEAYHLQRIMIWLDPSVDPIGKGFQHIQTLIAVGNGGLSGTGYAGGPQTQGGWLPLLYTDNIYALVAEELGFVGGVLLLGLFSVIVWRLLRIAGQAQDRAGSLVAIGVATYVLVQVLVNIGVVLQLLPVTGVSLPFVSYGGSSLVALMAAIGLAQSVLVQRKPIEFRA